MVVNSTSLGTPDQLAENAPYKISDLPMDRATTDSFREPSSKRILSVSAEWRHLNHRENHADAPRTTEDVIHSPSASISSAAETVPDVPLVTKAVVTAHVLQFVPIPVSMVVFALIPTPVTVLLLPTLEAFAISRFVYLVV